MNCWTGSIQKRTTLAIGMAVTLADRRPLKRSANRDVTSGKTGSLTNPTIEVRRRLKVSKRILLLEPYGAVADVIKDLLDQLDYVADVETSGHVNEHDLRRRGYHCVLVNLDQNRTDWRDYGLRLATIASGLGIPVVMIPDHETAAKTIKENGWLRLRKPFTIENLEKTLNRAVGGKSEDG
jgi:hypothetical protein